MTDYFIGIYWGARKESIETCVDKIVKTFDYLCNLDESFRSWYSTNKPKKGKVASPLNLSRDSVMSLLIKGQNYNDEGKLVEELGYLLHLKSEENYGRAHLLSFSCSGYSKVSKLIPNNVNLTLRGEVMKNSFFNINNIESLYMKLYEIWEPEEGIMREDK